jgi:hypothetical protein
MDVTTNIATDPAVLAEIMTPPADPISPGQAAAQEISFVYGNQPRSSHLSREAVTALITEMRTGSV